MNYEVIHVLGRIMGALALLTALGVAAVAVGAAAYCTKMRMRPAAAWLLALSWTGIAFMFLVVTLADYFLMPRFGWEIMRFVNIGSELVFLAFGILMAVGVAMFRPLAKAEAAGREVGHGA